MSSAANLFDFVRSRCASHVSGFSSNFCSGAVCISIIQIGKFWRRIVFFSRKGVTVVLRPSLLGKLYPVVNHTEIACDFDIRMLTSHLILGQILDHMFYQVLDQGFWTRKYNVQFYWDRKYSVQSRWDRKKIRL